MCKRAEAHATRRSPVSSRTVGVRGSGEERTARGAEKVARKRLSVERKDVRVCGDGRAPGGAAVGARERLHANDCPWNSNYRSGGTCAEAARGGHFELLQWAHENGCPWGKKTCEAAADNGQLEVLKWLRANGCAWDDWLCTLAAMGGRLKILKWAIEKRVPMELCYLLLSSFEVGVCRGEAVVA